jgi:hypothetical protein
MTASKLPEVPQLGNSPRPTSLRLPWVDCRQYFERGNYGQNDHTGLTEDFSTIVTRHILNQDVLQECVME